MGHRTVRFAASALTALVTLGSASAADAGTLQAWWRLDEGAGARAAHDSSGRGLNGSVGSRVAAGGGIYRFSGQYYGSFDRERLVTVTDNGALDPGSRSWAVTVRVRTSAPSSNVVQKGQAKTSGGYYKIEIHDGVAGCLFRDSAGASAGIRGATRVDDGAWHTIRCVRRTDSVSIQIDGSAPRTHEKHIGSVSNAWPLSIGGKYKCEPPDVTCDYLAGDIDDVKIEVL